MDTNPENTKYSSYWVHSTRPKVWNTKSFTDPRSLNSQSVNKTGPCNPVAYNIKDKLPPIGIYLPELPSPYGTRNVFYNSLRSYNKSEA
jgi:hypothetical protein